MRYYCYNGKCSDCYIKKSDMNREKLKSVMEDPQIENIHQSENGRLIYDEDSVYEIDEECIRCRTRR